jgi:hypothetical protein
VGEGEGEETAEEVRIEMEAENWKAVGQAVELEEADRTLLDKVQALLTLSDREFLHLMITIGKVAPSTARLLKVQLR